MFLYFDRVVYFSVNVSTVVRLNGLTLSSIAYPRYDLGALSFTFVAGIGLQIHFCIMNLFDLVIPSYIIDDGNVSVTMYGNICCRIPLVLLFGAS
jgi:hypothetical protein